VTIDQTAPSSEQNMVCCCLCDVCEYVSSFDPKVSMKINATRVGEQIMCSMTYIENSHMYMHTYTQKMSSAGVIMHEWRDSNNYQLTFEFSSVLGVELIMMYMYM
jgi:hypothetical protein